MANSVGSEDVFERMDYFLARNLSKRCLEIIALF